MYLSFLLVVAGIGVLLAQPISNQVDAFQHNSRSSSARPTSRWTNSQTSSTTTASTSSCVKQGHTALDTIQRKVLKARARCSRSPRACSSAAASAAIRRGPDLRDVGLPARLRPPDRRARARAGCPTATAPPRTTTRRACSARSRGYVRGQLAVQRRDGHDRRRGAVAVRRARHLPRRAHLRLRVRRVLRRDGAGAVHRPGARRDPADRSSRCSRTR